MRSRPSIIDGTANRIAVPDCVPRRADPASAEACATIAQVLRNDIRFEGLFTFVPESLVKSIPAQNPDAPNFLDWQGIGAQLVVMTRAEVAGTEMTVEVKAYAADSGQSVLSRRYTGKADNPRIFAHQASDDIMERTQYKGVARSRIAFTSDRDSKADRRSKEIYLMDYDGFNPRRLTVTGSLNINPTWSPDGRSLLYVSYRQGQPVVFRASIFEGKSAPNVTGEKGSQAFAPAHSPDGKRIAYREQSRRQHGHLGGQRRRHLAATTDPDLRRRHRTLLEPHRAGDRLHVQPYGDTPDLGDGRRGAERPAAHHSGQLQRRLRLEPVEGNQRDRVHLAPRVGRLRHRRASTWPPVRSARSPRAAEAASTPPGHPTDDISPSRAVEVGSGRSTWPTATARAFRPSRRGRGTTYSRTGVRERRIS